MIVDSRTETDDFIVTFYENGAVYLRRYNDTTEYLNEAEVEAILEHHNV